MIPQWIILFKISCILFYNSVHAIKCNSNKDCKELEYCYNRNCECVSGYVKYYNECFPVKHYGEGCYHDIQCQDSHMICTNFENDADQKMFCYCDPFHHWNKTLNECLDIGNTSHVAGNFREAYNVASILERSAQKVFLGVVIAGLICVSLLLSFIGVCSVYGCCDKHKKGRYGEDDLGKGQINEVAVVGLPGTYEAIDTDFSMAI